MPSPRNERVDSITIRGTEDPNAVPDGTSVVLRSNLLADQTVAITANDNDVQGLEVTSASISVGEGTTAMLGSKVQAVSAAAVATRFESCTRPLTMRFPWTGRTLMA